MSPRLERAALAAAILATLVAFGILESSRFRRGEVFPDGSLHASTPRGARALARAIGSLPGVAVGAADRASDLARCGGECTLLVLELSPQEVPEAALLAGVERVLRRGGRAVLAFAPLAVGDPCGLCGSLGTIAPGAAAESRADDASDTTDVAAAGDELELQPSGPAWWRDLRFVRRDGAAETAALAATVTVREGWPAAFTSPSRLAFAPVPGVRPIYRDGEHVVLLERRVGAGTLLVLADGAPLTNLALRDAPRPELVARLVGSPRQVLFEESHLGVVSRPGVVALARRYGLLGAAFALLVAGGLHLWGMSVPLARRVAGSAPAPERRGSDFAEGWIALLRRGVRRERLLATAIDVYTKDRGESLPPDVRAELAALARHDDPLMAYRAVRALLGRQRSGTASRRGEAPHG